MIITEIIFRLVRRKDPVFKTVKETMDIEEFNRRIKKGEKLSILDDKALNVQDYMEHHPAGRFLIEHCVGRDMSKFYYGGYSLENYSGNKPKRYPHGYIPAKIVDDLVVAHLV